MRTNLVVVLLFLCGMLPSASAQSAPAAFGPIPVPGTSVIADPDSVLTAASLAGLIGGDGNHNPTPAVMALKFPAASGQVFTFSASGTVSFNYNTSADSVGPDGAPSSFTIASLGSISGFSAPVDFPLVGVFTNGSPSGPAPPSYGYSGGLGQSTFAPLLNQVFFIGDGLTGKGSGSVQTFSVPASATELWLGFEDTHLSGGAPFAYGDNSGALTVSGTLSTAGQASPPRVNGVISASQFGGFSSIAPGTFIEIYGSNLAAATRLWDSADFVNGIAPTALEGTSVEIGGQAAFVNYVSPGQVNALVPSDVPTGAQLITVMTAGGTSNSFSALVNPLVPGLLAPASFSINGTQFAGAFFPDTTPVLPVGAIPGRTSRPAKPGDVVILYGIGFGPVTPDIPAGQLVAESNMLSSKFVITIGDETGTVQYAGLAPTFTGLYQFNVVVPQIAPGSAPISFSVGSTTGTQHLYLAVE